MRGDVTRTEDVARLFSETKERLGKVDIVVANAAIVKNLRR